jgi:glucosamine--fructose-6-phosphate aminotransferase (isomerizing)
LKKSKNKGTKLGKAVQIALNQVVGAYAIAVLIKKIQMK